MNPEAQKIVVYTYICTMKIEDAIQQKKFKNEQHKAHINLLYTAAWLGLHTARMLKPYGITTQQFNILRILRGLHPEPATVKLLTERMIDKMSNASRLVDKLLAKGLVERFECPSDRRRVDIRITDTGLDLLSKASAQVDGMAFEFNLSDEDAKILNRILDEIRQKE